MKRQAFLTLSIMKNQKVLTVIGSVVCIGLILAAVPLMTGYAKSPPKPTGELRIGVPSLYTQTFHPYWAPGPIRKFYYEPMYDFIIGVNEEGKPDPKESIAYKWEEAPDHMSWTFWIRDGVKFHDGTPLTLEDVAYSLDECLNPKNLIGFNTRPFQQPGAKIVPPNKVILYLMKPWPTLPFFLSPSGQGDGAILPKKYLAKVSEKDYEKHPIGTGPYKFVEQKEGDYIKFVAQDHHWRVGTPKYKYLTFKLLPEEGTREAALRSGEVDMIQVGITRANKLAAAGIPIHEKEGAVNIFLDFLRVYQPDNPLYKKEVRQALVYAIDKAAILKHVLMDRGKLMGNVHQMFTWSVSYKDYPVTPYDPRRAKQLLAEAGYPDGFTIYLYSYVTGVPEQKLVNEAVAGYWKVIGMDIKIVEMDAGAFFPIWNKHKETLGPAAFNHSWSSRPMSPWSPVFGDPEKFPFSQIKDPEMFKLIKEYESAFTLEEFIKADRACTERVLEMYWSTSIAATSVFFASSKDVPKWSLGRGLDCYRFEYVGATK